MWQIHFKRNKYGTTYKRGIPYITMQTIHFTLQSIPGKNMCHIIIYLTAMLSLPATSGPRVCVCVEKGAQIGDRCYAY
jgi:hypothetical protein